MTTTPTPEDFERARLTAEREANSFRLTTHGLKCICVSCEDGNAARCHLATLARLEAAERELGAAQAAAKVLAHSYDTDNRPPAFALEYGRTLPARLPHYFADTGETMALSTPTITFPALPIDPDDERIVDEMVTRREMEITPLRKRSEPEGRE